MKDLWTPELVPGDVVAFFGRWRLVEKVYKTRSSKTDFTVRFEMNATLTTLAGLAALEGRGDETLSSEGTAGPRARWRLKPGRDPIDRAESDGLVIGETVAWLGARRVVIACEPVTHLRADGPSSQGEVRIKLAPVGKKCADVIEVPSDVLWRIFPEAE